MKWLITLLALMTCRLFCYGYESTMQTNENLCMMIYAKNDFTNAIRYIDRVIISINTIDDDEDTYVLYPYQMTDICNICIYSDSDSNVAYSKKYDDKYITDKKSKKGPRTLSKYAFTPSLLCYPIEKGKYTLEITVKIIKTNRKRTVNRIIQFDPVKVALNIADKDIEDAQKLREELKSKADEEARMHAYAHRTRPIIKFSLLAFGAVVIFWVWLKTKK